MLMGAGMVIAIFKFGPNWIETHPAWFWSMYALYLVVVMAATVVYEALMAGKLNGQTLGKKALKIRIVRPDGSPISMRQAWGRALTRQLFLFLQLID
jgi:uncharacterized RDD family membrane protein YckC